MAFGDVGASEATMRVSHALRHPRGRYEVERASQLSGVPRSTLYDWRSEGVYVPDYARATPAAWSYRDLVYLRLLAWLRQLGMPRPAAAERVASVKGQVAAGGQIRHVRATRDTLLVEDEREDRMGGPNLLPFDDLRGLVSTFDLADPVAELRRDHRGAHGRLWAPDLVTPSEHTVISPGVLAGEPRVAETRIPSAAIHALHLERGLDFKDVVELYPGLTVDAAEDAYLLEQRLRGHELPEPVAA